MSVLDELDDLVSIDRGEVDRRIYSNAEVFEAEMEHIFGRAWLFLCHETQIPDRGDFFESVMGRDNVLVVRQKDGTIKGLINSCTHRGNAVCRAEEGNARSFLCTYHGWSFGIDGTLKGIPGYDNFYDGDLDKSQHGLAEIAQLASYRGFVFGTHDPEAPPLEDYLGPTGRLGIDLLAARGDMEVVPGIQKFMVDCNWKFAQDNLFDWYHPQVSHASAMLPGVMLPSIPDEKVDAIDQDGVTMEDGSKLAMPLSRLSANRFENVVALGEYGHGIGGPSARAGVNDQRWRAQPGVASDLGELGMDVAGHPSIFPTCWITVTSQISLRIPRSPTQTEIWWFTFVDRNASSEERRSTIQRATRMFGPSGVLEQDDGENWAQSTMQTEGLASQKIPILLNMGLGRGEVNHQDGVAHIRTLTNEHAQLWLYHSWQQWMRGSSWDELREATTPRERI